VIVVAPIQRVASLVDGSRRRGASDDEQEGRE
jgi:hypothetical protein